MEEEDEILDEFLVECSESLEHLDQEFVALEEDPGNADLLGSIFRAVHTIKGTCGFLGLPKLENVAHGTENILSVMRDREMRVTSDGITILLEAVDVIKEILAHIETERKEPETDYSPMRQKLDAFLESGSSASESKPITDEEALRVDAIMKDLEADALLNKAPEKTRTEAEEAASETAISEGNKDSKKTEARADEEATVSPVQNEKPVSGNENIDKKKPALAESAIRVDVHLLDQLINLVGELVLARNQLLQQARDQDGTSSTKAKSGTVQQINLITTELQDTVMKTRMQPIKNVWDKFPRMIRDLAHANGKSVDLVMKGAETELDKTLLEAIKDPMTHIIRNAVDHGIESADIRREQGKNEKGTLFLKAFHEGGRIVIQISDDGAGIDIERVKIKAIEKELITQALADRMSEREALHLIFHPGLSTAKQVTHVSGRGVGMDVVKTNIEKIGGTVSMSSRLGEGTEMRIEIPLTLAIIPALMVVSGGAPFAIPQASLIELVLVNEECRQQIEVIRGAHFYRLRGVLLPLIYLNEVLGLTEQASRAGALHDIGINIVVLKVNEHSFGLVVDFVNDSEEIVVKPVNRQLRSLAYLAGATILGDGCVALILDVMGVAEEGSLLGGGAHETAMSLEEASVVETEEKTAAFVLFSMNGEDRYAVSLSEITRLEEFLPDRVEHSSGQEVIQYRDDLLPLIHIENALNIDMSGLEVSEHVSVIVCTRNQKSVGMVVGKIMDIVNVPLHLHHPSGSTPGIRGSIVIQEKSTDLLDVDQVISCVIPEWMEETFV